ARLQSSARNKSAARECLFTDACEPASSAAIVESSRAAVHASAAGSGCTKVWRKEMDHNSHRSSSSARHRHRRSSKCHHQTRHSKLESRDHEQEFKFRQHECEP